MLYTCSHCDAQSTTWSGRCLDCGKWGTVSEMHAPVATSGKKSATKNTPAGKPMSYRDVTQEKIPRQSTGNTELDVLLGGGLVPGSVILLAGEPGIGKSTLLLSLAQHSSVPLLYIAGEESPQQIGLRAQRLGVTPTALSFLTDTDADTIAATLLTKQFGLCIVDSIQSITTSAANGEAGSVGQVKASAAILTQAAKSAGVPIILVGQVTKDGAVAGPKTLEHLVDVVLSFEGDRTTGLRLLRAEKNRFGATDAVALFRMTEQGLIHEPNPSALLLQDRVHGISGSVLTCVLEGNRPLLLEVQALVTPTSFPTPLRRAHGIENNRLLLLLAVIEKRLGLSLAKMDVHVNCVGGLTAHDPGIDVAIVLALLSAARDIVLPDMLVALGEVGLGGEIRQVRSLAQRCQEAANYGITTVLLPKTKEHFSKLILHPVSTLQEATEIIGTLTQATRQKSAR